MTDRHRFKQRATDLRAFAERIAPLALMPDRVTRADIQLATDLAKKAASDLDELVKAELPGCICRRVENHVHCYVDYAETCVHHNQLYVLTKNLKADYARMEKALKDEVRLKLVAAALTGSACGSAIQDEHLAENAMKIADDVIALITESARWMK